jgi:hypothetical protein
MQQLPLQDQELMILERQSLRASPTQLGDEPPSVSTTTTLSLRLAHHAHLLRIAGGRSKSWLSNVVPKLPNETGWNIQQGLSARTIET